MTEIRKLSEAKTGIHPLTVAFLLVVLILAIAGIAYIWTISIERTGHSIFILNAVSTEDNKTKIYIQNIGKGNVTLDTVIVNNEKFIVSAENCNVNHEKTTKIAEGQIAEIIIDRVYEGEVHIKAICKDGTTHEINLNL
jgi:hypothetical protein